VKNLQYILKHTFIEWSLTMSHALSFSTKTILLGFCTGVLSFVPTLNGQDAASHPTLKNNLLAWYSFDGNFTDAHGKLNATVANGAPGFGVDRFGSQNKAFATTGDNALSVSGITIANSSFSIQFWTLNPANWFLGQGSRNDNQGLHIGADATGLRCDYWTNDLKATLDPAGGWTHWVMVHNTTTKEKAIWRNGALVADTLTTPFTGTGAFIIGRHFLGGGFYTGSLDDIAIWNRALTKEEIAALFADGKGMVYKASTSTRQGSMHHAPAGVTQPGHRARMMVYALNGRLLASNPLNGAYNSIFVQNGLCVPRFERPTGNCAFQTIVLP
jgi:hypothetical protein